MIQIIEIIRNWEQFLQIFFFPYFPLKVTRTKYVFFRSFCIKFMFVGKPKIKLHTAQTLELHTWSGKDLEQQQSDFLDSVPNPE